MAGEVSRFVRMYRLGSSRGHEPVREQRRSPYSRLALGGHTRAGPRGYSGCPGGRERRHGASLSQGDGIRSRRPTASGPLEPDLSSGRNTETAAREPISSLAPPAVSAYERRERLRYR